MNPIVAFDDVVELRVTRVEERVDRVARSVDDIILFLYIVVCLCVCGAGRKGEKGERNVDRKGGTGQLELAEVYEGLRVRQKVKKATLSGLRRYKEKRRLCYKAKGFGVSKAEGVGEMMMIGLSRWATAFYSIRRQSRN
jgi:hypothetical protein